MKSKKYNAQRQGNNDHLHVQDELNKPALKKVNAKAKQDAKEKGKDISPK